MFDTFERAVNTAQRSVPFGPAWADDLFRQDESLCALAAELEKTPRPATVLSFDFFDTLVGRYSPEPVDVFIEVGRRLREHGLLAIDLEPESFRQVRQTAEARAREAAREAGRAAEVKLADIYAELAKVVRDPEEAAAVEYGVELDFCYLNPCTTSLLRHAHRLGYKIVILSDIYLSQGELCGILEHNGFDTSCLSLVLTSSDTQSWKGNGSLFRVAHRRLNIRPSEMLHVGDNHAADVAGASLAGSRGHHYYRITPYVEEVLRRERKVLAANHVASTGFDSLRVLAQRLCGAAGSDDEGRPSGGQQPVDPLTLHERDGAFLLGPMLARFADWCVGEFERTGVRRVLALMREGELLGPMLEKAAAAAGVSLTVLPCYCSRAATALAAVGEATPDRLKPLVVSPLEFTVRGFFSRLGIDAARTTLDEAQLDKTVNSSEMLKTLMRFATQGELKALVEERSAERRAPLWAYLRPLLGDDAKVGIIDLGWAGTIQKNLARICALEGHPVDFVGRYLLTNMRACDRLLEGADVRSMLGNMGALNSLCRAVWVSPQLLEETVNACVGSTNGYRFNDEGVAEPVLGPVHMTDEEKAKRQAVQKGMRHFQDVWLSVRAQKARAPRGEAWNAERLAELDRISLAILHRVISYPTHGEATRFGGLHREENFFSDYWVPIVNDDARQALRDGGIGGLVESRTSCWPQGVVATEAALLGQALSNGWDDAHALARFCATPRKEGEALSATVDEAGYLQTLLCVGAPNRVVFFGFDGKGDDAWLAGLSEAARTRGAPFTALHVAPTPHVSEGWTTTGKRTEPTPKTVPEEEKLDGAAALISAGGVRIEGAFASDAVLRQVRRHLRPTQKNLLIIDRSIPEADVRRILAQLVPVLGPTATIAVGHGGRELFSLLHEAGPFRAVRLWLHEMGVRLGYGVDERLREGHTRELFTLVSRQPLGREGTDGQEPGAQA